MLVGIALGQSILSVRSEVNGKGVSYVSSETAIQEALCVEKNRTIFTPLVSKIGFLWSSYSCYRGQPVDLMEKLDCVKGRRISVVGLNDFAIE